jgi:hypothetical protein
MLNAPDIFQSRPNEVLGAIDGNRRIYTDSLKERGAVAAAALTGADNCNCNYNSSV